MQSYSVQQIKFECLSYIKEFGARADQWVMGITDDPARALASHGIDLNHDIWLWKPAMSNGAARAVLAFFSRRFQIRVADDAASVSGSEKCVFLFKRPESVCLAVHEGKAAKS